MTQLKYNSFQDNEHNAATAMASDLESDYEASFDYYAGDDFEVLDAGESYLDSEYETPTTDQYSAPDVTATQIRELQKKAKAKTPDSEQEQKELSALLEQLNDALIAELKHDDATSARIVAELTPSGAGSYDSFDPALNEALSGLGLEGVTEEEDTSLEESDDAEIDDLEADDLINADKVEGDKAIYNSNESVEIRANFKGKVKTHEVTARKSVIIRGESLNDRMEITEFSEGPPLRAEIKIYKDGAQDKVETVLINGAEGTKIIFDVLDKSQLSGPRRALEKVFIGAFENSKEQARKKSWPGREILKNISNQIDSHDAAKEVARLLESAAKTGDDSQFAAALKDPSRFMFIPRGPAGDPNGIANDIARNLVSAMWIAAGKDKQEFKELWDLLPETTCRLVYDTLYLKQSEMDQDNGGRGIFSNRQAADKLVDVLERRSLEFDGDSPKGEAVATDGTVP